MPRTLKYILFVAILISSTLVIAFPLNEKTPPSGILPLDVLSSQPDKMLIPKSGDFKDKVMITVDGTDEATMIDLETWSLLDNQPDQFIDDAVDVAILPNGNNVIFALADGNLVEIKLDDDNSFNDLDSDDDEDSRQIDIKDDMSTPGIAFITADTNDDIVYMVSEDGLFFKYNLDSNSLTELDLTTTGEGEDETSTPITPTGIIFADSDSSDKILVTTDSGDVFIVPDSADSFTQVTVDASAFADDTPEFSDIALTDDGNYAYIVDADNDVVWVFSVVNEEFADQQSGTSGTNPVEIDSNENTSLTHVTVFKDSDGDEVAYVSGQEGLSVIDANDPGSASSDSKVIDGNPSGGDDEDPISLSSTPGPLASSSGDAGYVFSANSDTTISVLSDNPWVTITSIDPDKVTDTNPTFTVTFQSDIAGDYTVKINANPDGSGGVELIGSTSFTDVDTDITTASIDITDSQFERSDFIEGTNKVYVFVTDSSGNQGHAAIDLTVDRPPLPVTITGVNFGNEKLFIDFEPSTDEDIDTYELFAEPAENQSNPTCPGTLTFTSSSTISGSVDANQCEENLCETGLSSLVNGITYCVAVKAVDQGGQESPLATSTTPITPEKTVGPAGFLGETGCALNQKQTSQKNHIIWTFAIFTLIYLFTLRIRVVKKD